MDTSKLAQDLAVFFKKQAQEYLEDMAKADQEIDTSAESVNELAERLADGFCSELKEAL